MPLTTSAASRLRGGAHVPQRAFRMCFGPGKILSRRGGTALARESEAILFLGKETTYERGRPLSEAVNRTPRCLRGPGVTAWLANVRRLSQKQHKRPVK
jgi:hypothetical protein